MERKNTDEDGGGWERGDGERWDIKKVLKPTIENKPQSSAKE